MLSKNNTTNEPHSINKHYIIYIYIYASPAIKRYTVGAHFRTPSFRMDVFLVVRRIDHGKSLSSSGGFLRQGETLQPNDCKRRIVAIGGYCSFDQSEPTKFGPFFVASKA